jgi:superkiller protein 3
MVPLLQTDSAKALSIAQRAVHAEPARPEIRREVAALAIQKGEYRSALAVLAGTSPPQADGTSLNDSAESLCLRAIAQSLVNGSSGAQVAFRLAQKAVIHSPWNARGWQTLAFVRAQASG